MEPPPVGVENDSMEAGMEQDTADTDQKLRDLRERLARGDYAVDPGAVADAILRRARELALVRAALSAAPVPQSECSKPASDVSRAPAASLKRRPGSPAVTRPIQVIATGIRALARLASSWLRPLAGAQTHSS